MKQQEKQDDAINKSHGEDRKESKAAQKRVSTQRDVSHSKKDLVGVHEWSMEKKQPFDDMIPEGTDDSPTHQLAEKNIKQDSYKAVLKKFIIVPTTTLKESATSSCLWMKRRRGQPSSQVMLWTTGAVLKVVPVDEARTAIFANSWEHWEFE